MSEQTAGEQIMGFAIIPMNIMNVQSHGAPLNPLFTPGKTSKSHSKMHTGFALALWKCTHPFFPCLS